MQEFTVANESELSTVVEQLLKTVAAQQREGAAVVALHGDLGAGKTTFVQTIAATLGVQEMVTSPTFLIMRQYELDSEVTDLDKLVHVDAYRIESADELTVLDFAEILKQPDTIVCIEWAERVSEVLPTTTIHLRIAISTDDQRIITFHDE